MSCFIISRKVKMQLKCKKRICTVYREGAVTEWMHQKCFVKFYAADFSLDDTPWSDWPLEVDSDQIETLTENNQHYTMLYILVPVVHVCMCVCVCLCVCVYVSVCVEWSSGEACDFKP